MTDQKPITTQINGRVGILRFNRPQVMNAFDTALIEATNQAMHDFMADDAVLAIIIGGHGRCFSAGFDMKESAARGVRAVSYTHLRAHDATLSRMPSSA